MNTGTDRTETNGDESLAEVPSGYGQTEKQGVDWLVVQKTAIAGVEYPELSRIFGVPEGTIRSRSSRENWPVTFKLGPKSRPATESQQKDTNGQVLTIIEQSLAEIGEQHPLKVARYASSKTNQAISGDLLPVPTTWKELNIVDTMARRAIGLDKAQITVNASLWTSQGAGGWEDEAGGAVEVEATVETDLPDEAD